MKREKEKYSIQAVENAMDVLEQFKGDKAELGITELSRNLSLHKNNIFRLLATLESRGYIEQNKNNDHYRLGIKSLELGKAFLSHTGLIKVSIGMLEDLCSQVNETTYLGIMRENQVFYIEDAESNQCLRVASRVGTRMSPLCTAIGKIMLAHADEDSRDQVMKDNSFVRYTPYTVIDQNVFLKDLQETKERGYALDKEEKDLGVVCIAGPVYNYNDEIVAGISISGPATRLTDDTVKEFYAPRVMECCRRVSTAIGYTGYS
ncbi:MAG: IclR family transcriptional regulator [SAR324 cluster bacterium]|uniref:IclR family transcriptional regulator n=1 Tax=SAR324 cluster bacterium TaxID=2024889 RepID=A0A2A4T922_9DELT|nr:MAG: IclR family transcriptional regulator [SAR324 cluster bacterium]